MLLHFQIVTTGGSDERYTTFLDEIDVHAVFDRPVVVKKLPLIEGRFQRNNGTLKRIPLIYDVGSGTHIIEFSHIIVPGEENATRFSVLADSFPVYYNGKRYEIETPAYNYGDPMTIPTMPHVKYVRFASSPPNGNEYRINEDILVDVEFNKNTYVDDSMSKYHEDYPYVMLRMSSGDQKARYVSGNGTKILRFSYRVRRGDLDTNGVGVKRGVLETYLEEDGGGHVNYTYLPKKRDCDNHRVDYRVEVYER